MRRRLPLSSLCALTLAASGATAACVAAARYEPPPRSPGPSLDSRIEFNPTFDRILYAHPAALVKGVGGDGASGVNAEWERGRYAAMFIEEQRHGEEAVLAGIVHHDPELWRLGVREFAWGFAHQGPEGNFPQSADPFHSTSFFVEGTAHLILVLRGAAESGVRLPPHLLGELDSFLPRLREAAAWMASDAVWHAGVASDAPYTHRRFLVASALGLTAVLTGDRRLAKLARGALALGLEAQRTNGVFPELGGFDSSYQARGLVYAEHYLAWVPDPPSSLAPAIARGLAWERTRIFGSGKVSIVGNTRANGAMLDHNGPKRVVYPMVASALAWWGLASHRAAELKLAARVSAWGYAHPGADGI